MQLDKQFVLNALSQEDSWKAGDAASFSFGPWDLTLKKEDGRYGPFVFSVTGQKQNTNETISRKYTSMEKAFLHVCNQFNENAAVKNRFTCLADLIEHFPAQASEIETSKNANSMGLSDFLSHFDFDYDIVSADSWFEKKLRQQLLEDGKLSAEHLDKDLICLVDRQGAYLGNIQQERYPVEQDSISKIIDRMDVYITDSVIREFEEALENRGIDPDYMPLDEIVEKCKSLGVDDGEVSYIMADAVCHPEHITLEASASPSISKSKPSLDQQILSASSHTSEVADSVSLGKDMGSR